MLGKRLIVLALLSTLLVLGTQTMAQTELRQWASRAEASSQYTTTDWSASKATGEPDAMEACGDNVNAWASLEAADGEVLTLYYDTPVQPTQINIHQNYNPGAISSVELIPEQGDFTIPVANSADTATACPGVFSIDVSLNTNVIGVVINIDQAAMADWNEIDAVELVGMAESTTTTGPGGGPGGGNNANQPTPAPTTAAPTAEPSSGSGGYVAPEGPAGIDVTCPNGREIKNGVAMTVVQMRSGFNMTATAVGIDGFDPIIAVLDPAGRAVACNDDSQAAGAYSADLPTTGQIQPNSSSSQLEFANVWASLADVTIVVGAFREGEEGEFLLIMEGMQYTQYDNAGDPFAMQITPGMLASGIDPTVYMISVTNRFDPYISMINENYEGFFDEKGNQLWYCDDAGTSGCYGDSITMLGSYVSRTANRFLGGFGYDAMLTLPIEPGEEFYWLYFLMHSSGFQTYGDYVVAFHMGIGNPDAFGSTDA